MSDPAGEAVDRRPSRAGLLLAGLALVPAVAPLTLRGGPGALLAAGAAAALCLGAVAGSRVGVDLGLGGLVAGVVLAGAAGAPVESLLVSAVGALVAWDAAGQAVGLGEQLGVEARTVRAAVAHVAGTLLVCSTAAAVAYAAFRLAAGSQPVATLAALLAGAVLLVGALGD